MPRPAVSVVVTSDYASGKPAGWADLRASLAALARQDFPEPAEFLLVETAALAPRIPADVLRTLPSLRIVSADARAASALKNAGARSVRGHRRADRRRLPGGPRVAPPPRLRAARPSRGRGRERPHDVRRRDALRADDGAHQALVPGRGSYGAHGARDHQQRRLPSEHASRPSACDRRATTASRGGSCRSRSSSRHVRA